MRLYVSLTVVGGVLVVAGLATGLVGETLRLAGRPGWQPIVLMAGILVALGMSCGISLLVVVGWQLSSKRRYPPDHRATGHRVRDHRVRDHRATDHRATGAAGPTSVAASPPAAGMRGSRPQVNAAYVGGREALPGEPPLTGPRPLPDVTHPSVPPGYADQKMTQIKELYREAEEMGDAEFNAHWEELRQRQHELISQYFEQVGLGGAGVGHTVADRRPLWRRATMPAALRPCLWLRRPRRAVRRRPQTGTPPVQQ